MQFYGFLSNEETAALVGSGGSVEWLTFPHFDDPAVFCRLLGGDGHGYFAVRQGPGEVCPVIRQRYLDNSNILATEMQGNQGHTIIWDYLAMGRPELRRVVSTQVPVTLVLRPMFEYGAVAPAVQRMKSGAWFHNPLGDDGLLFTIRHRAPDEVVKGHPEIGQWELPPGRYECILRYVASSGRDASRRWGHFHGSPGFGPHPGRSLARNYRYWTGRLPRPRLVGESYREALNRALLVLYGLTFRSTGTIVAAPTTSLPEEVGAGRQWDYRYSWVRDSAYAAEALLAAGDHIGARRILEFFLNRIDLQERPFASPLYHADGRLVSGEEEMGWLPGFEGSRPCRKGNAASHQVQLDIAGDFMWVLYRYAAVTGDGVFVDHYWPMVEALLDWAAGQWDQPDASLWEFRGPGQHYTHSKLMCWVALHFGSRIARWRGHESRARNSADVANSIRTSIEQHAVDPGRGCYVQAYGSQELDASLLLLPLYGYCSPQHATFRTTLAALEHDLVDGPFVYRYQRDMLGAVAHPFILGTSWLIRVYLQLGRKLEAHLLLDGLLARRTDLGLFGEHVDVHSGQPRGNFPQAFSHLGVVMAILALDGADNLTQNPPESGSFWYHDDKPSSAL